MKIVLASGNQGKLREFKAMLAPYDIDVIAQSEMNIESAEETGLSFIENAILKARHAAKESGLPALADDSGLSIDALKGAPGIYSARFAGPNATDADNIQKALSDLEGVEKEKRLAQFHCVLALVRHETDPTPIICHGQWQGNILESRAGEGGFGYDPIFWVPEKQCSAAELSRDEKNAISHRGQAMKLLLPQLDAFKQSITR